MSVAWSYVLGFGGWAFIVFALLVLLEVLNPRKLEAVLAGPGDEQQAGAA